MSIEIELEEDGQVRVRVDKPGVSAVSDVMDPMDLIRAVADASGLDEDSISEKWYDVGTPEEEPAFEPGIDESAPPEEPSA